MGKRRAKSFSSVESMERVCGEKDKMEEVLREREERTTSVVGERRSVRRVKPSMEEVLRIWGEMG